MKKIINILAIVLSLTLLFGTSLMAFSDRVFTTESGTAGTIGVEVDFPFSFSGKTVLPYESMAAYPMTIRSTGNKLTDVKIVMDVSSNMPLKTGYIDSEMPYTLPFLYVFSSPSAKTPTAVEWTNVQTFADYRAQAVNTVTADYEDTYHASYVLDEYVLSGTGDVHAGHLDYETLAKAKAGAKQARYGTYDTTNIQFIFPMYNTSYFEDNTRNAYYNVSFHVYAKQHLNTDNTSWNLIFSS